MKGLSKKHFSLLVAMLIALSAGFVYGTNVNTAQGYHPLQQVSMNVVGNVYTSVDSSGNGYVDSADLAANAQLLNSQQGSYYLDLDNEVGTCTNCLTNTEVASADYASDADKVDSKNAADFTLDYVLSNGATTATYRPSFNGGDASNPPFYVDSSVKVTSLNTDMIDGFDSAAFCRSDGTNCPSLGGGVQKINNVMPDANGNLALSSDNANGLPVSFSTGTNTVTMTVTKPTLQVVTGYGATTDKTVQIAKLGVGMAPANALDVSGSVGITDTNYLYLGTNYLQSSGTTLNMKTNTLRLKTDDDFLVNIDYDNGNNGNKFAVRKGSGVNAPSVFQVDESGNAIVTGDISIGGSATVTGSVTRNCPSGYAGIGSSTCVGNTFNKGTQYTWYQAEDQCFNIGERLCTYHEIDIMCKKRATGAWFPTTGNWLRLWTADVFYVLNGPDGGSGTYSIGYGVDNPFGTPTCTGDSSPGNIGKLGTADGNRKSLGVVCCRNI